MIKLRTQITETNITKYRAPPRLETKLVMTNIVKLRQSMS